MKSTHNKTAEAAPALHLPLTRDRLTHQILSSPNNVFWIGAPKGMGKTVLLEQLSQALRLRGEPKDVLLISLEEGKGLDFVLRCMREHVQKYAQRRLETSSISLPDLLNAQNQNEDKSGPLHLMIDGLDTRQHSPLIHYLIESSRSLNGTTKLYLAVDDFLPLQQCQLSELYGHERLQHLNLQDLRMTQAEARAWLASNPAAYSQKKLAWMIQKSDGIPSVLSLLMEHGQEPTTELCRRLSEWIEHNLLLYLEPMEVLRLASLSILSQFTLKQAAQLIGVPTAATEDWLLRYKPLLFRYNQERTHFVWSQLMQPYFFNSLLNRYRDLLPRILKRSEPWLTDSNINPLCLEHLIHSLEKPWAKEILISKYRSWYEQRNPAAIIQVMEKIPLTNCLATPPLPFYYAWALILLKRTAEAHSWLDKIEELRPPVMDNGKAAGFADNLFVLRALAGVFAHPRPTYPVRTSLLASCLDKNSLFQGEVLSLYTRVLHAAGNSGSSKHALKKAIHFHQANSSLNHLSHAKSLYWRCDFNEGKTLKSIDASRQYLNDLRRTQTIGEAAAHQQAIAMVESCLAEFLLESNQLEEAKSLYLRAIPELVASEWIYESVVAQVGLIRLYISEGNHQLAQEEIERIKQRIQHRENTSLNAVLCFETMRMLRAQGRSVLPAASEYEMDIDHLSIESLFQHQHDRERIHWIKCHILILLEQGNYTSALIYAVKGLIKSLNLVDNRYRTLFANIKALCEFKLGQQSEAFKSMNEAMHLAQQHQFIRAMINDDFGWREVWQEMDRRQAFNAQIVPRFISELRLHLQQHQGQAEPPTATHSTDQTQPGINQRKLGLTDKEYELLQLLAEGLCNKTIATRSEIALTTVKWHLQNIFGKLQARNRTEAVVKAQELDLISKTEP